MCFITLEDETGVANLVVWPAVVAAFRKTVMTARLLEVHGRIQRDRVSNVMHLVAETLGDRSDALWRLSGTQFHHDLCPTDEVARPIRTGHSSHPRNTHIIPGSRDFH